VKYWEARFELFGPQKACLPLTLNGAMVDDMNALESGTVRCIQLCDEKEARRSIIYLDASNVDYTQCTRESMARAFWYAVHALLEDEESQKRGIVVVSYPNHANYYQHDIKLDRFLSRHVRTCLPVRISAFHICRPTIFTYVLLPSIRLFLGKTLWGRTHIHTGSQMDIMHTLEDKYGFDRRWLPSDLGGSLILDHLGWLQKRQEQGI